MASPFRDYLIGLTVIVVAACGYQFTAAKWLEPPEVEHAPIAKRPLTDTDQSLADLYPADAWQRGRAIRLKTQDGMLLFQNWEQNKDERDGGKKWRLWPITMVIGRGLSADASSEPILIEAAEGAVIEFSAALDVMSGVAPTIQRGQLLGDVHIQRVQANPALAANGAADADPAAEMPNATSGQGRGGLSAYQLSLAANSSGDDQTLDIRTANVGIDRRKIWTTEAIEMQVGRAVMVGRDLTLHLAASTGSPTSKSNLARSLDRMELIYLRELTLPLGKGGDPQSPDDTEDRGVVEVHCDGRIEYDFAMDQLLLDRNVRLIHQSPRTTPTHSVYRQAERSNSSSTPIPTGTPDLDQFHCNSLRLTLRDPLNSSRERATALDWIDRIEATGDPLRLSMTSQQFDLTAGEILFDPLKGWLVARARSGPAPTTGQRDEPSTVGEAESMVKIRRGDLHATLSQIVYRFDPKLPQQLGSVEVQGGGQVDYVALDSVFQSFAWRDSLRVAPLDVATTDNLHVRFGVWCDGAIRSLLADGGSFETDRIEGVIKPIEPSATPATNGTPAQQGSLDQRWFPDRFAAIGNVRVRSRSLHANTPQMNLFFEQSLESPQPKDDVAEGSSIRKWVSQPESAPSTPPGHGGQVAQSKQKSAVNQPPATIRGDQVTAKLTFGDGELTATDLSVVGNVEVTHSLQLHEKRAASVAANPATTAKTMTAVMTGDQLRLRDSGGSGDVLQLGSQSQVPARLELGDGYFVGPEIQVRPDDNYIWIPSAGEFVVPTAFLPALGNDALGNGLAGGTTGAARGMNDPGKQTRWTQSPRGRFGGSMTFDGRVATLGGGVLLQAAIAQGQEPSELTMQGDELTFTLETPVDLRSPGTFKATRLSQVSLRQTSDQPVELHVNRFAADGVRESRHEMVVSQLSWIPGQAPTGGSAHPSDASPLQGQVIAPGAGSYRGWFRTPPKPPRSADVATVSGGASRAAVHTEGMIEAEYAGMRSASLTPPGPMPEPTITGVHLVYQDGMRGDLIARSLTFDRGVRIGRKIVPDFDSRFHASNMDLLDEDELTLDCDQLRLAVDPTVAVRQSRFAETARSSQSKMAIEVQASGGIVFRTRTEKGLSEATADQCGYAIAKDLVTIVGVPGRPARFRQTDLNGKPVANAAIRSLTLRLDPLTVVSSQLESMSTGLRPSDLPSKR
ncbi:hypothetical protein [Allorhodopirellula solitaria]|uniref:OstA-like protein n=1 Tax=Allorhodopirellula solitaria TaxID=2527987 RepID=A0A5C5YG01_9BACT|nr:hypothetical protein [Allorhodopirellula solitaria]TWT74008.1 hypothetical protein CA85_08920 [Allorhodopirellula solitaria]